MTVEFALKTDFNEEKKKGYVQHTIDSSVNPIGIIESRNAALS
jgi:hypothetical protein